MPFYTWLRPRSGDDEVALTMKRRASGKIRALRDAMAAHFEAADLPEGVEALPERSKFVRIATWNIREFDSASYGYRSQESKAYIAEICSHFDLIALQEIRRDLKALDDVKRLLGPSWDYIVTDVTAGSKGFNERMAYLYNGEKVWFRHMAGELTLPHGQKVTDPFGERFRVEGGAEFELPEDARLVTPPELKTETLSSGQIKLKKEVEIGLPAGSKVVLPEGSFVRFAKNARVPINAAGGIEIEDSETPTLPEAAEIVLPANSLVGGSEQFARTPFIASFQAGWLKINLATVHIYFGSDASGMARRTEEIARLTKLLADRAEDDSDTDADSYFIALGDFNIVDSEHQTMEALLTNKFEIPEPLQNIPGSNVKQDKFYDQIALWRGESSRRKTYTRIVPYRAGVFDYFDVVYRSDEEAVYRPLMVNPKTGAGYASYASWRTHQMSDHLPMWVELKIDFAEEYLEKVDLDLQGELDD